MTKTTMTYWNPLNLDNHSKWKPIDGLEGMEEELALSIDDKTGEYTRITLFMLVRIQLIWRQKLSVP